MPHLGHIFSHDRFFSCLTPLFIWKNTVRKFSNHWVNPTIPDNTIIKDYRSRLKACKISQSKHSWVVSNLPKRASQEHKSSIAKRWMDSCKCAWAIESVLSACQGQSIRRHLSKTRKYLLIMASSYVHAFFFNEHRVSSYNIADWFILSRKQKIRRSSGCGF